VTSTNVFGVPQSTESKGIRFGNYHFSEPEVLPCAVPTCSSGLFAILVPDVGCYPYSFRVVYFDESENIPTHLSPRHEKYWSWRDLGDGAMNVRVAFLALENSSPDERCAVLSDLIAQYQPELNTRS